MGRFIGIVLTFILHGSTSIQHSSYALVGCVAFAAGKL
jgi:hypothetical protein